MNTRQIPIFVTLLGAAVACLISVLQGVEFSIFFFRFLISVLVFCVLGTAVKMFIDSGFKEEAALEAAEADAAAGSATGTGAEPDMGADAEAGAMSGACSSDCQNCASSSATRDMSEHSRAVGYAVFVGSSNR